MNHGETRAASPRDPLGAALGILLPTDEELRATRPVDPELAAFTRRVATLPEVRAERVACLRRAIAEGRYQVDARTVADRMIGQTLVRTRERRG